MKYDWMNPLASVIGLKAQLIFIWVPFSLKTLTLVGEGGAEISNAKQIVIYENW